jgi:hypothetical protein
MTQTERTMRRETAENSTSIFKRKETMNNGNITELETCVLFKNTRALCRLMVFKRSVVAMPCLTKGFVAIMIYLLLVNC